MSDTPRVSIITATFNRSTILTHAIESVQRQTFTDWEMIVVGDACTDDSAEVVASFGDARIRFVNLERNIGDQSGPNNVGVGLARAPLIAFLNHDDMYFPDHLSGSLHELDETGAGLVFAAVAAAGHTTPEKIAAGQLAFRLVGVPRRHVYVPGMFAPASSWLLRRSLHEKLGGWRAPRDCRAEPSHDFLFRAWKSGARLRSSSRVTVLAVQSGSRPGSYRGRHDYESHFYAEQMVKYPQFRESVLCSAAIQGYRWLERERSRNLLERFCKMIDADPRGIRLALQYGNAGRFIRHLRGIRGLGEEPTEKQQ